MLSSSPLSRLDGVAHPPLSLDSHSLSLLSSLSLCNTIVSSMRSLPMTKVTEQSHPKSPSLIVRYVAFVDAASHHKPGCHEPHQHHLRWDMNSYEHVFFYCFLDWIFVPWFVILGLRFESLWLTIWIFVVWSVIGVGHQQQQGQKIEIKIKSVASL